MRPAIGQLADERALRQSFRRAGQAIEYPLVGGVAGRWARGRIGKRRRHTTDAIAAGLRGFITSPINPMFGKLEDWMLDAIRWSLAEWKAARE
jgi:hypothetical protein